MYSNRVIILGHFMNKKLLPIMISLLLLLTGANLTVANEQLEPGNITPLNKTTIYVDGDNVEGPWVGTPEYPYRHITDGILNATRGDTVYVLTGKYYENIVVDKSITLFGENRNDTIIDGMYGEFVIHVVEDCVTIEQFTIRNSGGYMDNAGIKLDSENNSIGRCTLYRTKSGVYVNGTKNNEMNNCSFHTNGEGIYLKSSNKNKVTDCYFYHNALGINIGDSDGVEITDCYAQTNGIGFFFNNSSNIEVLQCAAYNNNDNEGGLFLNYCRNIDILNCIVSHNGFGIKTADCSNVCISHSDLFWNTHAGISIWEDSKDIEIKNCEITENFRFGIYVENSKCNLVNNNIYSSLFEMYSEQSLCDARDNWWGSPLGPTFLEHIKNGRLFFKFNSIQFFPWLLKRIKNAGSSWEINYDRYSVEINNSRYVEIELPGTDSDNDCVPDWWEEKWGYDPFTWNNHKHLDQDGDGLNNIEECFTDQWNSSPFHDDIFLEFDWVKAQDPNAPNKPCCKFISKMTSAFEKHNITLHVDNGNLEGGEEIPSISNFSFADLRDLYWNYFLHNDLNNPRKGIFHYCLVCDYGPGPGFAFVGWDHLDSFDISAQMLQNNQPFFSRERLIIGGSIHELGHTLGLFVDDHGGNDNKVATWPFTLQWWKYQNYKSCMNYRYTYKIIDYSDGTHGHGDFDDWGELDFSFFKNTHFEWPKI